MSRAALNVVRGALAAAKRVGSLVVIMDVADLRAVVAMAKEADDYKRMGIVCAKCDKPLTPPRTKRKGKR